MLRAYAWFSLGVGLTAPTSGTTLLGLLRFAMGRASGRVAAAGTLLSDCAPQGRKSPCHAVTCSGVPQCGLLAVPLAILLRQHVGRSGMRSIGALAPWQAPDRFGPRPVDVWSTGIGRLGGVGGPRLGGFVICGSNALDSIFRVLEGLGVLVLVLTVLVPVARCPCAPRSARVEPLAPIATSARPLRITEPEPAASGAGARTSLGRR